MPLRRRDSGGDRGSRPTYSSLGSRIEELLRLAEEQRDQIITEARHEAAAIVDDARKQAEVILLNARMQADQLAGGAMTEPGTGQASRFEAGIRSTTAADESEGA